jgi:hypothetical protein
MFVTLIESCLQQPGHFRFFSRRANVSFSSLSNPTNLVPKLPLLDKMAKLARENGLEDQSKTILIGVQHLLPTTATFFDTLIDGLGLKPSHMFFAGKFYSSYPPIEKYLRQRGVHLMPTRVPKRPWQFEEQMEITPNKGKTYMLDPHLQQFVVKYWQINQSLGRFQAEELMAFNNIEWIVGNSTGEKSNPLFFQHFSKNQEEEMNDASQPTTLGFKPSF